MKKIFAFAASAAIVATMLSTPVFAHGGHGGGHGYGHRAASGTQPRYTNAYSVCTVSGCTAVGIHAHDGTYYYCQNHTDGYGCGWYHSR